MRVRLKPHLATRYPAGFRRVGVTWRAGEWQDTGDMRLSPERLHYLTGPESRDLFDFDPPVGTPVEAVVAAKEAEVSLPGSPSVAEAEAVTAREEGEDDEGGQPRRGRRSR